MLHLQAIRWALSLLLAAAGTCTAFAAERNWTDVSGRKLTASLVTATDGNVQLRLKNGKISTVSLDKLCKADREFVRQWKLSRISWPDEVDVSGEIEVTTVREDESAQEFVYRTHHFEFHSDRKIANSLVKDFSLAFEGTYATLAALPLNLNPKPPEGFFQIKLFGDRFDYYAAGGSIGTAGVYIPVERHILVPMEGLNLKRVGSELRKNNNKGSRYDNSTLIHEITHQVMHDWLKHLPTWVIEGMAEYMSALPYANGKFRFNESARKNGLKAALASWRDGISQRSYPIRPAKQLFRINAREWSQAGGQDAMLNYSSAMLYVYYFMHLDGKGDGERMCAFTNAIHKAKPSAHGFLTKYDKTLRSFLDKLKKAEKNGNSGALDGDAIPAILRIPTELVVFKKGSQHRAAFDLLLAGNSPEELHAKVVNAFAAVGIRLE